MTKTALKNEEFVRILNSNDWKKKHFSLLSIVGFLDTPDH